MLSLIRTFHTFLFDKKFCLLLPMRVLLGTLFLLIIILQLQLIHFKHLFNKETIRFIIKPIFKMKLIIFVLLIFITIVITNISESKEHYSS